MKRNYCSGACLSAFLAACGDGSLLGRKPVPHYAILLDVSQSRGAVCSPVNGLGAVVLADRGARRGSTVSLLASGDVATAMEPRLVATLHVPVSTRVLDGQKRRSLVQTAFLRDLEEGCRRVVTPTEESPIFLGVKRAVELLQGRCTAGAGCVLFVATDGEERAEGSIKAALNGNRRARSHFPTPIANAGIRVSFCGLASTLGTLPATAGARRYSLQRDPTRVDRIRDVWLSLFAEPASVTLQPFCPGSTVVDATRPLLDTRPAQFAGPSPRH